MIILKIWEAREEIVEVEEVKAYYTTQ